MRGSAAAVADESVTEQQRDKFRHLQALDDALAFRLARVAIPCPDCDKAAEGKCDDHAVDLVLIELYKRDHSIASLEMSAARASAPYSEPPDQAA